MVLRCEVGIAEGKPLMEEYGLDELAASAEAVVAGVGPLAGGPGGGAGGGGRGGPGVGVGGGQGGVIVGEGGAEAGGFCQDRGGAAAVPEAGQDRGQGQGLPVALSADGKGVAMRPEARRGRAKAPDKRSRTFEKR